MSKDNLQPDGRSFTFKQKVLGYGTAAVLMFGGGAVVGGADRTVFRNSIGHSAAKDIEFPELAKISNEPAKTPEDLLSLLDKMYGNLETGKRVIPDRGEHLGKFSGVIEKGMDNDHTDGLFVDVELTRASFDSAPQGYEVIYMVVEPYDGSKREAYLMSFINKKLIVPAGLNSPETENAIMLSSNRGSEIVVMDEAQSEKVSNLLISAYNDYVEQQGPIIPYPSVPPK